MKSYLLGVQVVLATTFVDAATNTPTNPDTVKLELMDPLGTVTQPTVSNPSPGVYKANILPAVAGIWTCRWAGIGTVNAASEFRFEIRPSAFQS